MDRDAVLAQLLDELTSSLRDGRGADVERVAADHPELADELRKLWGMVVVTEEISGPLSSSEAGAPASSSFSSTSATTADSSVERPRAVEHLGERFGDYAIARELGRGGMGVVYEATQSSLGRRVALKVLLAGELAAPKEIARFRSEAEAAAALDHPNIVPILEVGERDERPYFTMRLVEGETLAQRLEKGPIAPREAVELILPIVRAIEHAHAQGVLHRDLKPSNILLDEAGVPYVTDFGLAKRMSARISLTQSGAIIGTPAFMSPEQAAGGRGEVGPTSDVYSLGAVLYHMLTGRPVFQAPNAVDVILAVLERDPVPPRILDSGVDRDLEMIVLKCLQKPPELRYRGAGELAGDLEAFLAGDPVSVGGVSLPLLFNRVFRETHHAPILENWGLLWMWHSIVLAALCVATNALKWSGVETRSSYITLWLVGLCTWASIFWWLRRRAGPITFVERQIAHVWASGVIGTSSLFFVELFLDLPVLVLSPVLPIVAGMGFVAKAGILSGRFYVQAALLFATSPLMVWLPDIGLTIFGLVSGACFFIPGLKYYRQRRRAGRGKIS